MNAGISPFALGFMLVSMTAVTALAGYCLWRVLHGGKRLGE